MGGCGRAGEGEGEEGGGDCERGGEVIYETEVEIEEKEGGESGGQRLGEGRRKRGR